MLWDAIGRHVMPGGCALCFLGLMWLRAWMLIAGLVVMLAGAIWWWFSD